MKMLKHLNTGKPKLLKINSYNKMIFSRETDVSRRGDSVSDGDLETLGSRLSHEIPKEAADVRPT